MGMKKYIAISMHSKKIVHYCSCIYEIHIVIFMVVFTYVSIYSCNL
jgi:hypothetical protein